jgi:diguanylate cyclase (GGDEF)-like protein
MNTTYYVQTLVTGMAILLVIQYSFSKQHGERSLHRGIFSALLWSNFALLFFELLLNLVTANTLFPHSRTLLTFIVFTFYLLNPLPGALWILYVLNLLSSRERLRSAHHVFIWAPFALNALLTTASLFGGYSFYIDSQNVYHRGRFFLLMAFFCYVYLVGSFLMVLARRSQIRRKEFFSLAFFPLPLMIGAVIQTLFYGLSVVWLSMTVSLLIIFLDIQDAQVFTDHLTGLSNRRRFDRHFKYLLTTGTAGSSIGGIMVDIDHFKRINDTYGHELGDRALEIVAKLLHESVRKEDLVARLGGDEFAILMEMNDDSISDIIVERIRGNLAVFNSKGTLPFKLQISVGHGIYDQSQGQDSREFLKMIDDRMYEEKIKHHEEAKASDSSCS